MADKHGIAGGADDHAEHGEPHISHPLGSLGTIPDTQHVAHGFEESVRVLNAPCIVLQGEGGHKQNKKFIIVEDCMV